MEEFEIEYSGRKVKALRSVDYQSRAVKFSTFLGITNNKDNKFFEHRIYNDDIGWVFSTREVGKPENFSNVWLSNNGKIGYNNSQNPEVSWSKEKFDPDKENESPIDVKVKAIFEVAQQLFEHEQMTTIKDAEGNKSRRSAEDIVKLRQDKLLTDLALLGYSSFSSLQNNSVNPQGYLALNQMGDALENYKNLAFFRYKMANSLVTVYNSTIPEGMSAEEVSGMIEQTESSVSDGRGFMEARRDYLDQTKELAKDYLVNMQRKISKLDWQTYSSMTKKTAELLLGLNADLIDRNVLLGVQDLTSLQGIELVDKISELIDSREFANACDIENRFVISEIRNVLENIDADLEYDRVSNSPMGDALRLLRKNTEEIQEERTDRLSRKKVGEITKRKRYEEMKKKKPDEYDDIEV